MKSRPNIRDRVPRRPAPHRARTRHTSTGNVHPARDLRNSPFARRTPWITGRSWVLFPGRPEQSSKALRAV